MTLTILTNNLPCHQYDNWCQSSTTKATVKHGFFTADGGVSSGLYESLNCSYGSADNKACINENRQRVVAGLGFTPDRLFGLKQYHSTTAILLSGSCSSPTNQHPNGDAYVSTQPNAALAILTADCAPVLFTDRDNAVIGAAHAGWRGATGGIMESTVKMMCDNGANLEKIEAVIGPTITKSNYQVSSDFQNFLTAEYPDASQFFEPDPAHTQKYHFDLPAFVVWQLDRIGLQKVTNLAIDTYDSKNKMFSHRRAKHSQLPDTGRQIAVIGLADQTK